MEIKTSYDYEDLLKAGSGELWGEGFGKLPSGNMLMMDRITSVTKDGGKYGKGEVIAELDINPDLWFFACHFKGDPVMPGSLGLDALWQLTGFFLGHCGYKGKGRALGCENVKFTGQVMPHNKKIEYRVDIKRVLDLKLTMAIADGRMFVDGKEIYSCESMRVGLFSLDTQF